ncbi:MAG: bifunctional 5,10-methylenetetrahydrofolate dehydrogenase/5,10-methenyltetrahydrofolate cyclohydrolase [Candidatus Pacebacteria bacterium]|nr:bifunctional 5,10-methylenetetrahydrofolate dehydrogenase/5,10-methenyltetrahydrofolate cyclohydrolase [Candidatus Paceibacterota bacterium]MBP9867216.1 bifunctional 5,10-methylenetetrahydrofolate dehydrogenase/5,10-methenyltetrahydrofolate cyclohydrolase [Candidatus Paceibacterota bacterium]
MKYDGKQESLHIQKELQKRVQVLKKKPVVAVISVPIHPSIASFIAIKKRYATALGITIQEYVFDDTVTTEKIKNTLQEIIHTNSCDGIIIQLPLPKTCDTTSLINSIPENLDIDVLGEKAWQHFCISKTPIPPVAGAIAHILTTTKTDIHNKKIVIIGKGKLVGEPISILLKHQGVTPSIVEINTPDELRMSLYKDADVIISGIGSPHHLKPEFCKKGVILIDAGTSEQSGTLSGDIDPLCESIASIYTPVPGGVGPLTVACLFKNLLNLLEKKYIKPATLS